MGYETLRFVYGRLRLAPSELTRLGSQLWHEGKDRAGFDHDWERPMPAQWRRILRQGAEWPAERPDGPRVLFATSYGFNAFVIGLHSMLAAALRLRGARPEMLICDGALSACDWNPHGNMTPPPGEFGPQVPRALGMSRCRSCTADLRRTYGLLPFATRTLREHLSPDAIERVVRTVERIPDDRLESCRHRDIAIGEHAASTTLRLLMSGAINQNDRHHVWLLRREVLGAAMAVEAFQALIDRHRPDCIVMQHGIYVTHGTCSDVARANRVRIVIHEWADRKNTFILSHGQTTHLELVEEPVSEWENLQLSPMDEARLDEYLQSKRHSAMDWMCHHPNPIEDWQAIACETGLAAGQRYVACFTNTMWDASIKYRSGAFSSILDWVLFTIECARKRPDLTFVIREHPGEAKVWGTPGQRILPELRSRGIVDPPNLKWVLAESDISSYSLAACAKGSVVYGTKLGLELVAQGLPVAVVGRAFVRGKGIAADLHSSAEYEQWLDSLDQQQPDAAQTARARRFAFHYYFRRVVEIPGLTMSNPVKGTRATLRFSRLEDLLPGGDRVLDRICDGVLSGVPFVFDGPTT
jgi:hypothetical protein